MANRNIRVEMMARVEGEGALELDVRGGRVRRARLRIFEPPRFFEALLRGRGFTEAPDITARICGICPVAYQMCAVQAMEQACGADVGEPVRLLRRLLYCGEWIESHAMHVVMLHAPDFLGYDDAIAMARDHAAQVRNGLALKKAGNGLMRLLGGREIHPVNVRVGGFYRVPRRAELLACRGELAEARDLAVGLLRWVSGFAFPDFSRDYEFVALRDARHYPIEAGRVVSSRGLDIGADDFLSAVAEEHVAHSTALHAALIGRGSYLVGPLARYALNAARLPSELQALAREAGLGAECRNPFQSIVVRALEAVFACTEALRLIDAYAEPDRPAVPVEPRAAVGHSCTEAPRGLLYHRYELAADGSILAARIIPPTSQNQRSIEEDLCQAAGRWLDLPDTALRERCEQVIRNYDPCISCSTHFLRLSVRRQ